MKTSTSRRRITVALIGLIVLVLGGWLVREVGGSGGTGPGPSTASLPARALSTLPPEAAQTWKLIEKGGPFPYPRNDGVVFENREKRLPEKQSGYYHEYTVPTPGSQDRGPRRLITGRSQELYYTGDHYSTFVVVDPSR
ncbi:ribonuclease N [Amycolatopsis cynarae]|uniref:Ribonuclease N n=1 Tax=Amycolatopsis cynarae TaxID=2995223 RepID=A0ABY7AVP0_9PSEU|nr:ribonuclease domain-containing protein [Amycolatopsis sp. HUAS 11-8]WAL64054.1 ribonuclease N [Amycolatopsis sp. HUAS 11-8]